MGKDRLSYLGMFQKLCDLLILDCPVFAVESFGSRVNDDTQGEMTETRTRVVN